MTLNNHDGDVYVETTGEYSEIVLKTQRFAWTATCTVTAATKGSAGDGVGTRLDALNSTNDGLKPDWTPLETAAPSKMYSSG